MATRRSATKRKSNTALVVNPHRNLGLATRRASARRASSRKSNGRTSIVRARTAAKTNPRRRRRSVRRNPIQSASGLLIGCLMAGIGISVFDILSMKVLPQTSGFLRVGVKLGAAYGIDTWGKKIPVLGRYNREIALVVGASGVVDLIQSVALPWFRQNFPSVQLLLAPPAGNAAQGTADNSVGDLYGGIYQDRQPIYAG